MRTSLGTIALLLIACDSPAEPEPAIIVAGIYDLARIHVHALPAMEWELEKRGEMVTESTLHLRPDGSMSERTIRFGTYYGLPLIGPDTVTVNGSWTATGADVEMHGADTLAGNVNGSVLLTSRHNRHWQYLRRD